MQLSHIIKSWKLYNGASQKIKKSLRIIISIKLQPYLRALINCQQKATITPIHFTLSLSSLAYLTDRW